MYMQTVLSSLLNGPLLNQDAINKIAVVLKLFRVIYDKLYSFTTNTRKLSMQALAF